MMSVTVFINSVPGITWGSRVKKMGLKVKHGPGDSGKTYSGSKRAVDRKVVSRCVRKKTPIPDNIENTIAEGESLYARARSLKVTPCKRHVLSLDIAPSPFDLPVQWGKSVSTRSMVKYKAIMRMSGVELQR